MSIVLNSTVDIAATPEQVWEVLSDFSAYGEWSTFSRVDGAAVVGNRLKMRMPGMSFRPTVTAASPNRELQWSADILTERLFLGEHRFTLTPTAGGGTRVQNTETFSGVSVAPFRKLFTKGPKNDGYAAFNQALKARVEARVSELQA